MSTYIVQLHTDFLFHFLLFDIEFIVLLFFKTSGFCFVVNQLNEFASANKRYFYQLIEGLPLSLVELIHSPMEGFELILWLVLFQFDGPSLNFEVLAILFFFVEISQGKYLFIFASCQLHVSVLRVEELPAHVEINLRVFLHAAHGIDLVKC